MYIVLLTAAATLITGAVIYENRRQKAIWERFYNSVREFIVTEPKMG